MKRVVAVEETDDRRRALIAAADAYMVASVGRQAILDRLLAVHPFAVRRAANQVIESGDLRIDLAAEQARWRAARILLRPN